MGLCERDSILCSSFYTLAHFTCINIHTYTHIRINMHYVYALRCTCCQVIFNVTNQKRDSPTSAQCIQFRIFVCVQFIILYVLVVNRKIDFPCRIKSMYNKKNVTLFMYAEKCYISLISVIHCYRKIGQKKKKKENANGLH